MDGQRTGFRAVVAGVAAAATLGVVATAAADGGADHAEATLVDVSGATVGSARFVEDAAGVVHVTVHTVGMSAGLHGIHVHGVGSCASGATAFSGAGSHHNPVAVPGDPAPRHGSHAGDLPNLVVNPAGVGHLAVRTERFTLGVGWSSIFDADGSALIVHALADDGVTDPTGGSGARIACGVISAG